MARAFAPVLAKNGGGAIVNVLSVASWGNSPTLATYGASKSAAWALTNGLRIELAEQGTLDGVVPLKLDVTSDEDAAAAASAAADVNLLVNNAGIARPGGFLTDGAVDAAREQFEVNFVGPLRMARAFAPVLAKNGGGAIVNVLSVASWRNSPMLATYGASKSAAWALTNGLRIELAEQGTQVVGLHAAFIDTDLTRNIDAPKSSPEQIARTTLDALERGEGQVLADEITRQVHGGLSADPPAYFQTAAALRSGGGLSAG